MPRVRFKVVADDNMPGVEACCALIQGADFDIVRHPGRTLSSADVADADWLFVRSITPVNAALLAGSRVRFVGTATIGTDHLDLAWLAQQGIAWAAAPGCNARAVGEWVLAMIVRLAVEQTLTDTALAGSGNALAGKTLGIVGLGHVGRWVARMLAPLGLRVLAYDPLLPVENWPSELGVQAVDWPTLLAESDIVTLHTPLTRQGSFPSFHLMDAAALAQLKPTAWLLNAGRGAVIDHDALLLDLHRTGRVVALDVWEGEPKIRPEVLAQVRYGSPHIAGHSLEGKWRGSWQIAQAAATVAGLTLAGQLTDILPTTGVQTISLAPKNQTVESHTTESDTLPRLHALLQQILAQGDDDTRLRAAQHEASPAAAFDALRKHYPVRREFPAHQVQAASDEPLHKLLIALGFSC